GVDSYRFFGAAFEVVKSMSYSEGFSTITMQLARDLFLNRRREITRKLREIMTAIQIEKRYSKNEILEMYLNKINFGHGKYGIHEAASFFFETEVEDLKLEESALLVALLKGPWYYSPLFKDNGTRPLARRNLVLRLMYEQGYINAPQYNEARLKPIVVYGKLNTESILSYGVAPYFTEHIRQKLEKMKEQYGFDIYRDGLKVYTTLDTRAQAIAEKAVEEQIVAQQNLIDSRFRNIWARITLLENLRGKNIDLKKVPVLARNEAFMDSLLRTDYKVQAAFAAMDLKTGRVLALIGGRDFATTKFNRALQARRQPGSVFKPFIYTTAISNGYSFTFELLNQPVTLLMPDGTRWTPTNYDPTNIGGYTTLREGLTRSINNISVRMVQKIVPATWVADQAKAMGITTPIPAVDAIALGTASMILMEVISAYSAFPNGGIKVNPVYITKIEDRFGSVLYENPLSLKEVVLSEQVAYLMTDGLKGVVLRGTGQNSHRVYGFRRPAGGKTGTTNDHTDAWFVGFTPQIIAGTWVGIDDPAYSLGPGQSGAIVALPIWSKFMKAYHDTLALPVEDFVMPTGVERLSICNDTKDLATRYCPVKFTEIFISEFKPTQECRIHRRD
ncbi:transglycosylase domain-containing protein, partial [candidate division KSB1 bacterium]|nr:transglycosylase domain-containing protein [candidate division KSB1 bacterium]